MTDVRTDGLAIFDEMLPGVLPVEKPSGATDGEFGGEMANLVLDNVFGTLWARDGLDRRSRSLVTLGILIALRATDELEYHVPIALRNGLTEAEIAEVIYHSSGYAGFPAANTALTVAKGVLAKR